MVTRPPFQLIILLVLGAVGLALVAVGVVTQHGWRFIVPGFAALVVSLVGAWVIQKRRDGTLR